MCARLLQSYPGACGFVSRLRAHAAQNAARRWQTLPWRDKLVWLIERALWNETPAVTERSPSLAATLHAIEDDINRARASRSTRESIHAAGSVLAMVRGLSARDFNNMMFSAASPDGFDPQSVSSSFDDAPGDAPGHPASQENAPESTSQSAAEAPGMGHSPLAEAGASASADSQAADTLAARGASPRLSIPLTTAFDIETDLTGLGDARDWHALRSLARAETAPLKTKLERALKADELTHWKREQERGEMDRTALARLALSPGYRTPFRVRRVTRGRDAAVTLLVDRSGSMAGKKIELARLCAAALCDALTQLGFDSEVLGYSSIESEDMKRLHEQQKAAGADLRPYNRFVERLDLQIYKRFGANDLSGLSRIDCGHENPDGEALAWAATRLAAHKAGRRILMVLSDGYPAAGDGNAAVLRSDLLLRVDAIRKAGIEIIGVGILDDAVEAFYPNSIVVRKLHELPGTAFSALSAMLLDR